MYVSTQRATDMYMQFIQSELWLRLSILYLHFFRNAVNATKKTPLSWRLLPVGMPVNIEGTRIIEIHLPKLISKLHVLVGWVRRWPPVSTQINILTPEVIDQMIVIETVLTVLTSCQCKARIYWRTTGATGQHLRLNKEMRMSPVLFFPTLELWIHAVLKDNL